MNTIFATDFYNNGLVEAFLDALMGMYDEGVEADCPDYNTQCLEASLHMIVKNPLGEPRISKVGIHTPESLQQYVREIRDGIMDFEVDEGKWSYTYHQRMDGQIQGVINELRRNPHSRRAVIRVADKYDLMMDDPPCLQLIQYQLRDNRLDCTVYFRSNDLWKATFMNAFALIELQKYIADELVVEMGTYEHIATNCHIYEQDYAEFLAFLAKAKLIENTSRPLVDEKYVDELISNFAAYYHFPDGYESEDEDDWFTMMESANPDIDKKIEKLMGDN